MKELLLRTVTGIALVISFIGSILLGPTPMLMMVLLVYGLGCMELFKLKKIRAGTAAILLAISGGLAIITTYAVLKFGVNPLWFILSGSLWIAGYLMHAERLTALLVLFWITIPLSLFIATGWLPEGSWGSLLPLAVIALVWVNDTFAYVWGSLLGKHTLTPKLSPGKTWEGFIGGMLFAMLSGWIFYHFTGLETAATWISAGAVAGLFGLAGDLFESWLKRRSNTKDTGGLLPGHGGVLDRFDSLLFVAPAMFLLILLLQVFS